ncbi:hypothetical protein [Anabaena sp. UHCC 0399]|uniref:hypothetical protein n=1 Tax=Anabaena sp. UHCC 0399 TaxID=3110238 RepID=UPI002B21C518|nr:hypothetical protein [Anabaena sp. UHCC 0399]MEA5564754.1 hypothetical protein [Anabaena sp. UHCC 0399]
MRGKKRSHNRPAYLNPYCGRVRHRTPRSVRGDRRLAYSFFAHIYRYLKQVLINKLLLTDVLR